VKRALVADVRKQIRGGIKRAGFKPQFNGAPKSRNYPHRCSNFSLA
jgi:hypothetical protein